MAWLIILILPYLFPLSIWIQITIHPLSTDGAIVILIFSDFMCSPYFMCPDACLYMYKGELVMLTVQAFNKMVLNLIRIAPARWQSLCTWYIW